MTKQIKKNNFTARIRHTLTDYGTRTTIHGVSHYSQSSGITRKIVWAIITVIATLLCCYHVYHTISNFQKSPITTIFVRDGATIIFPDVTFCNMRPVGDSVLKLHSSSLYGHMQEHWDFFNSWFVKERTVDKRKLHSYRQLLETVFQKLIEMFWVTDDTQEIGMSKSYLTMIHCMYNGEYCKDEDFILVQQKQNWNCYTFAPKDRKVYNTGSDSGLKIIAFTDSDMDPSDKPDIIKYLPTGAQFSTNVTYSFQEYIEHESNLNEIITGLNLEGSGLKVYIHNHKAFPTISETSVTVTNGLSSVIEFTQTNYDVLNHDQYPCHEGQPKRVNYTISFENNGENTKRKAYELGENEIIIETKQSYFYNSCQCYSHNYPFKNDIKDLCYYIPSSDRKKPSNKTLKKVHCHDKIENFVNKFFLNQTDAGMNAIPCHARKYEATTSTSKWPGDDDLISFVNLYFMRGYINRKDNHQDKHILSTVSASREEIIMDALLNQNCSNTSSTKNLTLENFWCTSSKKLLNNIAAIWVKPRLTVAGVYSEHKTYQWPEVLSEIGGTLGLWLGMSILTATEILELILLCIFSSKSKQQNSNGNNMTEDANEMKTMLTTNNEVTA